MIGDRDKLENRIVDIQQCQQVSGSAELQFLLAYIYYQMGKLELAKEAIDQASEKMPDALAVLAVKKAIEDSIEKK
jgi:tetratricopeptide (TPR) repeat protein